MRSDNDGDLAPVALADDTLQAQKPTVLCVDDDPNISEAIGRRLQRLGIRVLRAYDGMQGCWQAATERPGIIVLDVAMPNGNGVEILQWLKRNQQTAGIPVVVLTGKTDPGLCRKMRKLGAIRFLAKPVPFEELLEEITREVCTPGSFPVLDESTANPAVELGSRAAAVGQSLGSD
jgi:FixJ family two-component response regulator